MQSNEIMALNTCPKLLVEQARKHGNKSAMRFKEYGIWQTRTWTEVATDVCALACGLASIGFKRGDRLAIMGDNRPQLYQAVAAVQSLGGIPIPIHRDAVGEELVFVLNNAEVPFVLIEGQEQVNKVFKIRNRCLSLSKIICLDCRSLPACGDDTLFSYEEVLGRGRVYNEKFKDFFFQEVQQGHGEDTSIIFYTWGTLETSKGVCLSYDNLIITGRNMAELEKLGPDEEVVASIPMALASDHMISYVQSYIVGYCVNFPESGDTILADIREIGPTYFLAPPWFFEQLMTKIMVRGESGGRLRRSLFRFFLKVAREVGTLIVEKRPVRIIDRLLYGFFSWIVYKPLMDNLGFSRIRVAYAVGAAIGSDIFNSFRSIGLNLKQVYGLTEASVFVTVHKEAGDVKADTVGTPIKDVEVKIGESGEVLIRGPGAFQTYLKCREGMRPAKDAEGWVRTGDIGRFNGDGHLIIIGRINEILRLDSGKLLAPEYIESKLKFSPYISNAVCIGHNRKFVCAIINIDPIVVSNWAQQQNLLFSDYPDLAGKAEVCKLIAKYVEKVNLEISKDSRQRNAQIKRFAVLPRELDAVEGELTCTKRVHRQSIMEKYAEMIDALFENKGSYYFETLIRSTDGHVRVVGKEINIHDVQTFA
jgi:long-chain acyl-CoA synthetase